MNKISVRQKCSEIKPLVPRNAGQRQVTELAAKKLLLWSHETPYLKKKKRIRATLIFFSKRRFFYFGQCGAWSQARRRLRAIRLEVVLQEEALLAQ